MNARQSGQLDTLHSAKAFLEQHATRVQSVAGTGMMRDLDGALARLDAYVEKQGSRRLMGMGTTQRVSVLRRSLMRDHMSHIARVANVLFPDLPELSPLRMPADRPGDRTLASVAEAMGTAAAAQYQVFMDAGLPADFLERLSAAADGLLASRELGRQMRGQRSGATAGLQETVRNGRRVLRALDAFMETALMDDPALLANWKAVIRVRQPTGAKAATR